MTTNRLYLVRGDHADLNVTLSNLPAGGLTDADIVFTVDGLLAKSLSDGITVTDAVAGTIMVTIDSGDTDAAPDSLTTYHYDIEVTFPDGTVQTPILGVLSIEPDITTHAGS